MAQHPRASLSIPEPPKNLKIIQRIPMSLKKHEGWERGEGEGGVEMETDLSIPEHPVRPGGASSGGGRGGRTKKKWHLSGTLSVQAYGQRLLGGGRGELARRKGGGGWEEGKRDVKGSGGSDL